MREGLLAPYRHAAQETFMHINYPLKNAFLMVIQLTFLLLIYKASALGAGPVSNIDPIDRFAWSENTGWFNFRPVGSGMMVYDDHLEGYAWSENMGWIKLGSHTGGSPCTYANTSTSDWGVNRNGTSLSGMAWSENAGWIKFNPLYGGVTVDPVSGTFDGYAWGENIGWIHFRNDILPYNVAYLTNKELTVQITGSGSVSGISDLQQAFSCPSAPCSASYIAGDQVTLSATPVTDFTFSGWFGACNTFSGDCTLDMILNRDVTAIFTSSTDLTLLLYPGHSQALPSVAAAYGAAPDNTSVIIRGKSVIFNGDLNLDRNVTVDLQGGFNNSFNLISGHSSIHGSLTIGNGALTVGNIVLL